MLVHGQLKSVLGSTLTIERRRMVVEVHDPDGDWDHGLGGWDPGRADLSHLGWGQVAIAVWQETPRWPHGSPPPRVHPLV